jgi:hypothetical protein
MTPMSNDNILPNGTITYAMECGRPLEVVIVGSTTCCHSWAGTVQYDVVYIGNEKVCLDFGQNWFAEKGYRFKAHPIHIARALELKAAGY